MTRIYLDIITGWGNTIRKERGYLAEIPLFGKVFAIKLPNSWRVHEPLTGLAITTGPYKTRKRALEMAEKVLLKEGLDNYNFMKNQYKHLNKI